MLTVLMCAGRQVCLTVTAHPHRQALPVATLLAAVPVDLHDGAALALQTLPVLDVLLDAAAEKALQRTTERSLSEPRTGLRGTDQHVLDVSPCSLRRRELHNGNQRPRHRRPYRTEPHRSALKHRRLD